MGPTEPQRRCNDCKYDKRAPRGKLVDPHCLDKNCLMDGEHPNFERVFYGGKKKPAPSPSAAVVPIVKLSEGDRFRELDFGRVGVVVSDPTRDDWEMVRVRFSSDGVTFADFDSDIMDEYLHPWTAVERIA